MSGTKKPVTFKRLKNQFLSVVTNPFNLIVFITLVLLVVLIVIPLLRMLQTTFTLATSEIRRVPGGAAGDFTLYYWTRLFASELSATKLWKPLANSLMIGAVTSVIAVPLGAVLAWLMVRSDLPAKKIMGLLIIVPYMIPSWCKAMSWLAIFRNSRTGKPGLLEGFGLMIPDWLAYGPVAMILTMVLHYYAFSYIMVSSALRSVNSELEEMGEIQGASKLQILRKITLPLVTPAILSAAIMAFSKSIGTYGVAATLGLRAGYFTLSTQMRAALEGSSDTNLGYVMALLLIVMASGTIFANQKMVGTRKSYETVGGKGTRHTPIPLGKAKYPICGGLIIFLVIAMVFPTLILIMETFQVNTGGGYALSNLTTYYWTGVNDVTNQSVHVPGIFNNPEFLGALKNTILLTVITAVITALCGQILGYISARGRNKWYGKLTEQLVFVPYLMPSVAFSAIYLAMWSKPHWFIPSLYGTFALLVLTSVVKHFPFASRAGTANMMQISSELEEAAEIQGAGFFRRITRIIIPLAKQGFLSGFMLVFISIAKELDLIILLMSTKNRTLSYLAFTFSKDALPQMADAVTVCVLAFVLVSYWIAYRFGGADVSKSWG
ncbi:MAG: iron ABC transporter permease [Lachnospiraceae bacterium]|nr:iron ABC transporter permease [Lachnospiraceae bacterium]